MKGKTSVNPVFEGLGIHNPTVYSVDPLIVSDNHRLFFRSQHQSTKWTYKSIISCCYSERYGCVLVLSEEGRLHVFTEDLNEIARIPWESKYSVGIQLIDSLNLFLMIGATELEVQYVLINSNIKKTKFISSMFFSVERRDRYVCEPEKKLQWHKGYNYDLSCNLLYLWSSKDINFYSLDKLKLHSHIPSLTRKDISITYVLYNRCYKYTITGLANGHVKVWRLNQMNQMAKDYILIHNFIHHSKQVDKIVKGSDDRIIITSSAQLLVCLWTLETFEQLREYSFAADYSRLILHSSLFSYAVRDSCMGKLKFGKSMEFITDIASELIYFDKCHVQAELGVCSPVESVQITLASNMGFRIRDDQLDKKDLNKINIENIYPPLKAKTILQIISSPYTSNQFYLLVENGEIFRLRIEDDSGRIQESYNIERAKDVELHQLNQLPAMIKFLPMVPPQFDSEINDNVIEKKSKDQISEDELFTQLKLITVGCNKGAVVFLRTQNLEQIYTRVTYHREAIITMESFKSHGFSYLATCCMEKHLKIIRFDGEKGLCILSIFYGDTIRWIKGFQDRLAVVMPKGMFQIFQLDSQSRDSCVTNSQSVDHDDQILSLDDDCVNQLVLTASADNSIKVWTYNKVLVYEITMDDGIKGAIWFRNFEMLIEHNLKILYFRNVGLKITADEIEEANQVALEECDEPSSICSAIEKVLELKEDYNFEMTNEYCSMRQKPLKHRLTREKAEMVQIESIGNSPKRGRKEKSKRGSRKGKHRSMMEEEAKSPDLDLDAVRKHMKDMKELKKQTNESILPKIKPKNDDAFDGFMKAKLLNKKVLTRRDITLNRIIMKNIIRDHFGNESEITNNLKLDF